MRQRVMIAMALALDPQLMIMDEPTTALDVVVQREILREILRLRDELGFAVIFITHDLPLLLEISDRDRGDAPRARSSSWRRPTISTRAAARLHQAAAGVVPQPDRRPRPVHPQRATGERSTEPAGGAR